MMMTFTVTKQGRLFP